MIIKKVDQDHIKTKTKRENEKEEESIADLILLDRTKIIASPRYTSSFLFHSQIILNT